MSTWGGRKVTRARAAWAARLPLECYRCGQVVEAGDDFDLEHDPPRSQGGTKVVGVSHPRCNRGHGARLGNAMRSSAGRVGEVDTSW